MDNHSDGKFEAEGAGRRCCTKRPYQSPVLTEYGSLEELVDSGVVGSVPSISTK